MNRRRTQKGYALISVMAVSIVAMSITGVLMMRMNTSSKQITQREMQDAALNISEAAVNQVLDAMAEVTSQTNISVNSASAKWGAEQTAVELAEGLLTDATLFNTSDFMNTGLIASDAKIKFTRLSASGSSEFDTSNDFFESLQSQTDHSTDFWAYYKESAATPTTMNIGNVSYSGGNPFSFDQLHADAYTTYTVTNYSITKGNLTAEMEISIVPLANDVDGVAETVIHDRDTFVNHMDVYKMRVVTYVPNKTYKKVSKTVDVIINRPAKIYNPNIPLPEAAILTGGTANVGNVGTSAGECAGVACIDTAQKGDVHVNNGDLIIGAQGSVQGKATATGKVTVKTTDLPHNDYTGAAGDPRDTADVTSRITGETGSLDNAHNSRSGADEIEIPEFDTSTSAVDSTPCLDTNPDPDIILYQDCKLTGDYVKNNNNPPRLELKGTVHIAGDFNNQGSVRCAGPATSPCRVVIDGTAETGGNGTSNYYSAAESLYVVRGFDMDETPPAPFTTSEDCLDIGGTPDANGSYGTLFYVENPNCNSKFHGNFAFFGAIFSNGTFEAVGNASDAGIQRDTNMNALKPFRRPRPMEKADLFPKVISWKDRR